MIELSSGDIPQRARPTYRGVSSFLYYLRYLHMINRCDGEEKNHFLLIHIISTRRANNENSY